MLIVVSNTYWGKISSFADSILFFVTSATFSFKCSEIFHKELVENMLPFNWTPGMDMSVNVKLVDLDWITEQNIWGSAWGFMLHHI